MADDFLELSGDSRLMILRLSRPERRNALHGPMWHGLRDRVEQLRATPPRVLIVTGSGEHFCAGMDLKPDNPLLGRLVPAVQAKNRDALRALIVELKSCLEPLTRLPCPTIAAIEGACAGGGVELALACDLRVASREAFFSLPETRIGMLPDLGGCQRSIAQLGPSRAADLILTGRRLTPEEALRWGLVTRLCAPGSALQAAQEMAADICKAGPVATCEALQLIRAARPSAEAFEAETDAGLRTLMAGECVEGAMAWVQRRAPSWDDGQG